MADDIKLHFRLSWAQRQFLAFLAQRGGRATLNPEAEGVAPHWKELESLRDQGALTMVDIVGSTTRKELKLTDAGDKLVEMIREDAKGKIT